MPSEKLMGFWYTAEAYQYASGLPTIKALRIIVASLIRNRIAKFGPQTVLSLGIGTGRIYKELLGDELRSGSLKVIGIDISPNMLSECADEFPIPVKISPELELPVQQKLVLTQQSVLDDFGLAEGTIDIVESVLVLHHVAHRAELENVIRRIRSVLKENGIFILGDIDLSLAAHIERKERGLLAKYASVKRDLDLGVFVCKSVNNDEKLIPILDRNNESDQQLIEYAMAESFSLLEREREQYDTPETRDVLRMEVESFLKGGEWNRSLEEWRDISLEVFPKTCIQRAVKPDDIRNEFEEVKDRPFVLTIQKGELPLISRQVPTEPVIVNYDTDRIERILSVKAGLLCLGIRPDENTTRFYREQNPYLLGKSGTVGVHLILDDLTPVLVSTSHSWNKLSPYHMLFDNGSWYVAKDGQKVIPANPSSMPQWYGKTTSRNTPMTDAFLFEGLHYFHLAYEGCDLFSKDHQCKFCSTGKKWHTIDSKDAGEVIEAAYSETPDGQVCLGGGTHLSKDKGAKQFVRYISEIRSRVPNVPIWVEMVPPDSDKDIQLMIDAGATSFQFNIEIWDDEIRSQVCPGKFEAASKERYFSAFKYVNQVLGPNKIGSMLIIGLEPLGRTLEGIKALIESGVKPGVAPFRPWDGAIYQSHIPASPEEVIEASRVAARQMREFGVDPRQNQGCSNCHACAIEDDYYQYIFG